MPTISMFYGILILMYFYDNKKHSRPHIHAEYGEYNGVMDMETGGGRRTSIHIVTSSGISGIFDVKPYMKGGAFKELADESYFRMVRPAHCGIMWPHEQDFSSDTIIWDLQHAQQEASPDGNSATLHRRR